MQIVPATPELWRLIADLFAAGGDPTGCWYQWQVGIAAVAPQPVLGGRE